MTIKDWIGKHETTTIITITIILSILFLGTLAISNYVDFDSTYDQINITYQDLPNQNKIQVTETYLIDLNNNNYYVLYKSFDEPISNLKTNLQTNKFIQIQDVTCASGTPYISAETKSVLSQTKPNVGDYSRIVQSKILTNEVGCFKESQYQQNEKEIMTIYYTIDKTHHEANQNIHWLFSQDHFKIKQLNIIPTDNDNTKTYNLVNMRNVKIYTQTGELKGDSIALIALILEFALAMFYSFLPFLIWHFFGREKQFTVPSHLHGIPNKSRTPWQASLFLSQSQLSKDGFSWLFLSLKSKGVITGFKTEKSFLSKKLIINMKKDLSKIKLDELEELFIEKMYVFAGIIPPQEKEQRYNPIYNMGLNLIKSLGERSVDKGDSIDFIIKEKDSRLRVLNEVFTGKIVERFQKEIIGPAYGLIALFFIYFLSIPAMIFLAATISEKIGIFMIPLFISTFLMVIFIIISPSSLLSRFKGDYYKEYLEWKAFKDFLEDYAQIKKYGLEHKDIFEEWLDYAVALGSAEKILKAMKELKILDPQTLNDYHTTYASSVAFSHSVSSSIASSSGGHGGGGGGGGGGSGGGGGGGR